MQTTLTPAVDPALSRKPRFQFPRRFRFTRIGRFFTGMTVLVSVAAFNTGNNPLYLLFGMMLSLIIISGILSEQVLQKVTVSRDIPPRFFAGQEGIVMLRVKNTKKRAPSFSLRISDRIQGIPRDQHPSIYLLRVDAGQEASAFYRYTFPRRGVWQLEGVEVATSFPFELFRKGLDIDLEQEVVVFPRPAPPPPLPLLASLPQGSQPRPYRGSEGDFFALKEHRPGDDLRQVHWKASAKRDQLVTRELERQEAQRYAICFENLWIPLGRTEPENVAAHRQRLEQAIAVCAGLAQHLIRLGHPVALVTLSGRTPYGSGLQHLDRIWHHLARLNFVGDPQAEPLPQHPTWSLAPTETCIVLGHPVPLSIPARVVARIPF